MDAIHSTSGSWTFRPGPPAWRSLPVRFEPLPRVYGRLGEEALAWVQSMNVVSKTFERHVAGFVR